MALNNNGTAGVPDAVADVQPDVSKPTDESSPDRNAAPMAANEKALQSSQNAKQQQPSAATAPEPDREEQPSATIPSHSTPADTAVAPSSSELEPSAVDLDASEETLSKNQMKKRAKIQRCTV